MAKTFEFKVRIRPVANMSTSTAYEKFKDWIKQQHHTSSNFDFRVEMVDYIGELDS